MCDDEVYITAGELRAAGCRLSESIPDVARVPRVAIQYGKPEVEVDSDDAMTIRVSVPCTVGAPFEWWEVKLSVPEGPPDDR